MDQDATWYAGRPRLKRHCVRWEPSSALPKRDRVPPIFGPCLLWPNGCMDQDAVWYRGSLGLGRGHIVLDGNPTRLRHKECTCMMFVVTKRLDGYLVRCMVGLGPGNTVLDADPAPLPRGTASTQISALVCCGQMAGWIEMPWYEGRPQPRPHCVTYGDPAPTPERGTPPIFSPCLLWAIKTVDHLSYC